MGLSWGPMFMVASKSSVSSSGAGGRTWVHDERNERAERGNAP